MEMITEKINKFIADNGGNERDALNVALARLEAAELRLKILKELCDTDSNKRNLSTWHGGDQVEPLDYIEHLPARS